MADSSSIPSISFAIRQAMDRLQYQHEIYNQEFKERLKLVFGHPDWISDSSYGVVSPTNPASALPGGSAPLTVSANVSNTLMIDINPGLAVNPNGMWILLSDYVRQVQLANISAGIANVVYLRYVVSQANPEVNDYYQDVIPYTTRPGGLDNPPSVQQLSNESSQVVVDELDIYLQYDADTRKSFVPIAVVSVQTTKDPITGFVTNILSIDHTQSSYPWNRPWFSAQDIAHRNMLGTGTQTLTNIHAQSQNDLTVGAFTPFQLYLDHGMVIADDQSIPKQPGYLCSPSIPYDDIETDIDGSKTGFLGKMYIELSNYPVRLGKVWVDDPFIEELAALKVEGTNRIVFAADPPPGGIKSVRVNYTTVDACEPPVGSNVTSFTTKNPIASSELVVAGGIGKVALSSTTEEFNDAAQFPMMYELLVDHSGDIIKAPQVVYCYKKITDIGSSDTFSITQYGPAKIMMGLIGASGNVDMEVKLRVYGKDSTGASIDYLFEFVGSNIDPVNYWVDPSLTPNSVTPAALKLSTQVFSSVDQIAVDTLTLPGVNAAIVVWALLNPYDTYDLLKDACLISEVMWDGIRFYTIKDRRIIGTTVRDFLRNSDGSLNLNFLAHLLAGGNATIYTEDFRNPKLHNQILNKDVANTYTYSSSVNNISKLVIGQYGVYETRALPVLTGSGLLWRVAFLPINEEASTDGAPTPSFSYYDGSWHTFTMTPVAGLPNMYEHLVTTSVVAPTRVKVSVAAPDYHAMVLFG